MGVGSATATGRKQRWRCEIGWVDARLSVQHKPCGARLPKKHAMNRAPQIEAAVHHIEALRATMEPVTLEEDTPEHAFTKTR